jgi:flagellar biosynthetic protein FliR
MSGDDAALLAALPAWAFAFVLVMSRIGAAMMLLPGLGEAEPPMMVRVGMTLGITALLLPGIAPSIPKVPDASAQAAFMGSVQRSLQGCGWDGWRGCWCWPCR